MKKTSDPIERQDAINAITEMGFQKTSTVKAILCRLETLPSAQPEITRCNDCIFGYLYMDVQNEITDSWIECRNPEGLNRDVSVDGYCYASIRRSDERPN